MEAVKRQDLQDNNNIIRVVPSDSTASTARREVEYGLHITERLVY